MTPTGDVDAVFTLSHPALSIPIGVAVTSQQEILVADQGNYRLVLFNSTGDVLAQWNSTAQAKNSSRPHLPPIHFQELTQVAIGLDGAYYVVDSRMSSLFSFAPYRKQPNQPTITAT